MRNHIRIQYLRDSKNPGGRGNPIGCVAIRLVPSERGSYSIEFAVSVLNPADTFNRAHARQLAIGRLMENPAVILGVPKDVSTHTITSVVMQNVLESKVNFYPDRARKAARRWLNASKVKKTSPYFVSDLPPGYNFTDLGGDNWRFEPEIKTVFVSTPREFYEAEVDTENMGS